jgi:DNA polymerase III sliding clamp (beta) subunit (PCNA family)
MSVYRLKIRSREAYAFKVAIELCQRYLKDGCFVIDKTGIKLDGTDSKTSRGTKLINLDLPRSNFTKYKVPEPPLHVGLNMVHFYRMLKSIKKKDSLTLYILEKDPMNLFIQIHQNGEDEDKSAEKSIKITQARPCKSPLETGYGNPIIATAKEFQKMKTLSKISKTVTVTAKNGRIEFFCDKENVYTARVPFGDIDSDDEEDKTETEEYNQVFDAEQIIDLVKMGSMSNTIQIYATNDLPLYFHMNVGPLGTVSVYIKSREAIAEELEDTETQQVVVATE